MKAIILSQHWPKPITITLYEVPKCPAEIPKLLRDTLRADKRLDLFHPYKIKEIKND